MTNKTQVKEVLIQGLDTIHVHNGDNNPAVIILHGYGANSQDLYPLWEVLGAGQNWDWYFPNGMVRVPFGDYWEGRAWFSIDQAALEESLRTGRPRDFLSQRPEELDGTLTLLSKMIQDIAQKHSHIIIGGFSQGAMCSAHLSLMSDKISHCVLLSGVLIDGERFFSYAPKKDLKVFQSHGKNDQLLGFEQGRDLHQRLINKGATGEFYPFSGGHEIPPAILEQLKLFLALALKG